MSLMSEESVAVQQARSDLDSAVGIGNVTREDAARKRLAAAGVVEAEVKAEEKPVEVKPKDPRSAAPVNRHATPTTKA